MQTATSIDIRDLARLASWEYFADRWWCTVCQWRIGRVPTVAERVAEAAKPQRRPVELSRRRGE
jgi:predicted alpha-1,6-mannanase (GH76 family)